MTAPIRQRQLTYVEYARLRGEGHTDDEMVADNLVLPPRRLAQDNTTQARNAVAGQTARDQAFSRGVGDAVGMVPTAVNQATFGLADEVVPGMKGAISDFAQRKPGLDQIGQVLGSLAGPGAASVGAVKAIAPLTMLGQVGTGAGVGAVDSFMAAFGNTEGDMGTRIAAGTAALPKGTAVGAAFGAVPGVVVKAKAMRGDWRQHVALGRTAVRSMRGLPPHPTDVMTLLRATPADDLNTLMQRTGGASQTIDANDLLGLRRLSQPGLGTTVTPVTKPGISPQAMARKQRGRSQGSIDREAALRAKGKAPKITPDHVKAVMSDPKNVEALLQMGFQRVQQQKAAEEIVKNIVPPELP